VVSPASRRFGVVYASLGWPATQTDKILPSHSALIERRVSRRINFLSKNTGCASCIGRDPILRSLSDFISEWYKLNCVAPKSEEALCGPL